MKRCLSRSTRCGKPVHRPLSSASVSIFWPPPCTGLGGMRWDGVGWDEMGWDGMGWDGMRWNGMGWDGWVRMG